MGTQSYCDRCGEITEVKRWYITDRLYYTGMMLLPDNGPFLEVELCKPCETIWLEAVKIEKVKK